MSSVLEHWPFDYNKYTQQVLPALTQAMQGHPKALLELVDQGERDNLQLYNPWTGGWTQVPIPPYSPPSWEQMRRCISRTPQMKFGEASSYGLLLHTWLIRIFCMQGLEHFSYISLREDESIWLWRGYMQAEEDGRRLWELFYAEPDEVISCAIPYLPLDKSNPRALDPFAAHGRRGTPMGFITPEETRELYEYVKHHNRRNYRIPLMMMSTSDDYMDWAVKTAVKESTIPGFYEGEHTNYGLHKHSFEQDGRNFQCFVDEQERQFFQVDISANDGKMYVVLRETLYSIYVDRISGPLHDRYYREYEEKEHAKNQEYLEWQWEKETEMFKRLSFAVEQGWGMLMCYVSGG